jgi:hypothetical protein
MVQLGIGLEGDEMAERADFTDEEWAQLEKGVMGAGLLVTMADRGFFETFKEAGAQAKHLQEARQKSDSALIRELAGVRHTGFGVTDRPEKVERETLEALGSSVATLSAKAPDDVDAYRALVIDVAESVAKAAHGVDAKETGALDKIKAALQGT